MYILASLLLITFMYIFKDKIDLFFKKFDLHFQFEQAGAGRNFNVFKEKYGFFKNIIKGSLVAFYGPTFKELKQNNILIIFSFVESFILIILLIYNFIKEKKYFKGVCFFVLIILLISHYPFGIFNSGAAVRYRTNIIILITILPYLLKKF